MASSRPSTTKPVANPGDSEYDDAERNYQPRSVKFWMILCGMYFSLFLVALVRTSLPRPSAPSTSSRVVRAYTETLRIEQSSRLLFPLSQTNFALSTTSAGTAAPTCWPQPVSSPSLAESTSSTQLSGRTSAPLLSSRLALLSVVLRRTRPPSSSAGPLLELDPLASFLAAS